MPTVMASGLAQEQEAAPTYTVLHKFAGGSTDGAKPYGGLIRDAAGNLYGTTAGGGASGNCGSVGCGTIFKLTPGGTETILHSFVSSPTDGANPQDGLIRDAAGNLYGTTARGGAFGVAGAVFKLTPSGTITLLHSFGGGGDGAYPYAGLILDAAGNLYGTATQGGASNLGVVFKLSPGGTLTLLHSFAGPPTDGQYPYAGLILDSAGNLYGTTVTGGASNLGLCSK